MSEGFRGLQIFGSYQDEKIRKDRETWGGKGKEVQNTDASLFSGVVVVWRLAFHLVNLSV